MAQERRINRPMKDMTSPEEFPSPDLHKSLEYQLIKTSASYFDLDLPEKYKQALVNDRNN